MLELRGMNALNNLVRSPWFERFIMLCILLNSAVLGAETARGLSPATLQLLGWVDRFFLIVFTVEIALKLSVFKLRYVKDPWGLFDMLIVGISWMPANGAFAVMRALRVLRTLRMVSVVPSLRKVVTGLLVALPGLGAVAAIILLLFYVGAVMATKLFGAAFPEWFGSIGGSAYTLFQVMTLEGWSMGIVRPVMEQYPHAWAFFLPFILITTFTMLNLFIAVIVNAMQAETETHAQERAEQGHEERVTLLAQLAEINQRLQRIEAAGLERERPEDECSRVG
jgi:voltage-gated sodium channel